LKALNIQVLKQIILKVMIEFLLLGSCKEVDSTFSITQDQLTDTTFLFALASSAEALGVLLSNGVNCAQSITFSSTNVATVIVTDIVNTGTYIVDEKIITVTFQQRFGKSYDF
jgi:hypothetical protein